MFRDRETIAADKKDIETKLNEVLTESKKHAIVANNLFHSVQDFVGFKSLDQPTVLEPLFPTQYFIAHESIEVNRKEVRYLFAFRGRGTNGGGIKGVNP